MINICYKLRNINNESEQLVFSLQNLIIQIRNAEKTYFELDRDESIAFKFLQYKFPCSTRVVIENDKPYLKLEVTYQRDKNKVIIAEAYISTSDYVSNFLVDKNEDTDQVYSIERPSGLTYLENLILVQIYNNSIFNNDVI